MLTLGFCFCLLERLKNGYSSYDHYKCIYGCYSICPTLFDTSKHLLLSALAADFVVWIPGLRLPCSNSGKDEEYFSPDLLILWPYLNSGDAKIRNPGVHAP